MIVGGLSPVYYWDGTINNGDGTFGTGYTVPPAGIECCWSNIRGSKDSCAHIQAYGTVFQIIYRKAINLRGFISVNTTHWFISLVNGGDSDLPPCGQVDRNDPQSPIRCEIVPEMNTGETFGVRGVVTNRTNEAWDQDPIALQVDIDGNGQFLGAKKQRLLSVQS